MYNRNMRVVWIFACLCIMPFPILLCKYASNDLILVFMHVDRPSITIRIDGDPMIIRYHRVTCCMSNVSALEKEWQS